MVQQNNWRIQAFAAESLRAMPTSDIESERPILVVGMIRSGTTLMEQLLARHPAIGGAGEQPFWSKNEDMINRTVGAGKADSAFFTSLAHGYLDVLGRVDATSARVVDKLPSNYQVLGPIRAALPNARIIHCRRNPVDNALSIYMMYFDTSPSYGHDRDNIVFMYRQYERLMEHWRSVLPPDRFMEVDYEDVVADSEAVIRRVIAFCGIEWDDRWHQPQDDLRSVRTPSLWQARQPVYRRSMERWRNYEPWLGELKQLLA
jgi:hypothetical protein